MELGKAVDTGVVGSDGAGRNGPELGHELRRRIESEERVSAEESMDTANLRGLAVARPN